MLCDCIVSGDNVSAAELVCLHVTLKSPEFLPLGSLLKQYIAWSELP